MDKAKAIEGNRISYADLKKICEKLDKWLTPERVKALKKKIKDQGTKNGKTETYNRCAL